jgi:predicted phage terminase large subunit-like protein
VLVGRYYYEYHVLKCYLEQTTTAAMVRWHFDMLAVLNGVPCGFYMEKVFMQDVLIREINDGVQQSGVYFNLRADGRKKPDKYTRIEGLLEPLHRNGNLYFAEAERHNPHMQRLEGQFKAFSTGSSAHDDGPDAVEGAVWILREMETTSQQRLVASVGKRLRGDRF